MKILQLNPPLSLNIPGKGSGLVHLVLDYGAEYHLMWVVLIDDTGEIWTFDNTKVRGVKNINMGRYMTGVVDLSQQPKEDTTILSRIVDDLIERVENLEHNAVWEIDLTKKEHDNEGSNDERQQR